MLNVFGTLCMHIRHVLHIHGFSKVVFGFLHIQSRAYTKTNDSPDGDDVILFGDPPFPPLAMRLFDVTSFMMMDPKSYHFLYIYRTQRP